MRLDARALDALRPIEIIPGFVETADGSCLIACGKTKVICTASIEEKVPPFLRGSGKGWVTAEYAMLPASTGKRKARDGIRADGRGVEIRRLIGRALRQAVDLSLLGERTITLDCDVLQADGGTRTASITGAFVALVLAVDRLLSEGLLYASPLRHQVAAVSCGIVSEQPMLDLCYQEDHDAAADINVIMQEDGALIEVQGTGEERAYSRKELTALLDLAHQGIDQLMQHQKQALGKAFDHVGAKPKLVVATGNAHKLFEFQQILGGRFEVVSLSSLGQTLDVEETADTFEGNALLKAEAVLAQTGLAALADDSGLEVDALYGAPGVYSARYAGEHGDDEANNQKLLLELTGVPAPRTARYVAALALARPGKEPLVVRGTCAGEILEEPRGDSGFGYDPLFFSELGKTFAQASLEEKNRVSHRSRAAAALMEALDAKG